MSKTNNKTPEVKNKSFEYKTQLEAEIKRLKSFRQPTEGLDKEASLFIQEQASSRWKAQDKNRGKFSVINYGTWTGPKNWRSKAGTLEGRISLLEQELKRTNTFLGKRYHTPGEHVPVSRGSKPFTAKKGFLESQIDFHLGRKQINPWHMNSLDVNLQEQRQKLKVKQREEGLTEGEQLTDQALNQPDPQPKQRLIVGQNYAMANTNIKKREKAPADLAWVDIDNRAKGHTLTGPNYRGSVGGKNSVANNKARLLLNRARDINRAYGGMNDAAKTKYLNNPITQLELEA